MELTVKPVKFKKSPLLYGASYLLDIFGPNLVVHRRSFNVESGGRRSIYNSFSRVAAGFAKVMGQRRKY